MNSMVDYTATPTWKIVHHENCGCMGFFEERYCVYDIGSVITYLWERDIRKHTIYHDGRAYIFTTDNLAYVERYLRWEVLKNE